jgi:predicted XRE-type DNA-binding protein/phage-related protein
VIDEPSPKPLIWIGSSRKDLREFPEDVQHRIVYALWIAQTGGKHRDAKALSGFGGAGVLELIEDYRGDTFRAVYTLKYAGLVYVARLSKEIENGARNTAPGYRVNQATTARSGTDRKGDDVMNSRRYEKSSGNVFKDLGLPDAEEHLVKAKLVWKIDGIMKERGLKQVEVAALLGIRQPDVSKMLRGEFRQFSVERLLRFLVALGQDVEIVVKPHQGKKDNASLHVS